MCVYCDGVTCCSCATYSTLPFTLKRGLARHDIYTSIFVKKLLQNYSCKYRVGLSLFSKYATRAHQAHNACMYAYERGEKISPIFRVFDLSFTCSNIRSGVKNRTYSNIGLFVSALRFTHCSHCCSHHCTIYSMC